MWLIQRQPVKFITVNSKEWAPMFNYKKGELSTPAFQWDLIWITVREPNENADFPSINMAFIDDDCERWVISLWFNSIATSVINSLAWAMDSKMDMKNMTLVLYTKNDFPRCSLKIWGQATPWKYDMAKLNWMTKKVKVNGKEVTDREKLNDFLREVIKEIDGYLKKIYWEDSAEELVNNIEESINEPETKDASDEDFLPF